MTYTKIFTYTKILKRGIYSNEEVDGQLREMERMISEKRSHQAIGGFLS